MNENPLKDLEKLCNEYKTNPYKLFYERLIFFAILEIFTKMDEKYLIKNINYIKKVSKEIFRIFKNKNDKYPGKIKNK